MAAMMTDTEGRWYILHTRSRFEKVVHDGLVKKGKEVFLPTIRTRSRRLDRKLFFQQPLFPGYLFVKIDNTSFRRVEVLQTAGAVRLIGNRNEPLPVSEEIIASLKIIITANEPVNTGTCFYQGEPVRVVFGPFAGVIGIFSRYQGSRRVLVNIDAMNQAAAISVSVEDIEPLKSKTFMIS